MEQVNTLGGRYVREAKVQYVRVSSACQIIGIPVILIIICHPVHPHFIPFDIQNIRQIL